MSAKTSENLYLTQLIPESQSYTLKSSHEKLKTKIIDEKVIKHERKYASIAYLIGLDIY
jgi:hypothetical protein